MKEFVKTVMRMVLRKELTRVQYYTDSFMLGDIHNQEVTNDEEET